MDFLKAELERKKKEKEALLSKVQAVTRDGSKKYVRRGDLERVREAEAIREQMKLDEERRRKRARREMEEQQANSIRHGLEQREGSSSNSNVNRTSNGRLDKNSETSENTSTKQKESSKTHSNDATDTKRRRGEGQTHEEDEPLLPKKEVIMLLRELNEPITLFGERPRDRQRRLRECQRKDAETSTEHMALSSDHAIRNRFLGNKAQVDDDDEDDDAHEERGGSGRRMTGESRRILNDGAEDSAEESARENHTHAQGGEYGSAELDDHQRILRFFKRMIRMWEQDLSERPEHIKRTAQGKIATKTMKQCKDYIRPLFKLCKAKCIPEDILPKLVEIVDACEEENFVKANDAYIQIAIGNAAWPIGVTMVGIHERTGREKINSSKVAHVMNNELQRKYLTSVKRLISFAQTKSGAAPSRKVLI